MELTDARRWHRPGVAGRERFGGSFKLKLKLVSLICNACILARKFVMYAYLHASLSLNHACITIKLTKFKFKFETAGETLIAARRGCAREASAAARRTGGMKGLAVLVLVLHAHRTPSGLLARWPASGFLTSLARPVASQAPHADDTAERVHQGITAGGGHSGAAWVHVAKDLRRCTSRHLLHYRAVCMYACTVASFSGRIAWREWVLG